ncbi:MAG: cobalamin-independent methionine synthase II family protein [Caldilineaceae bacterium]
MKLSTDRILTTHVGSLPRPQDVVDMLFAEDRGADFDRADYQATMRRAVADSVRKQIVAGVDVPSDGEMSKISYATYIRHRLSGFEIGEVPRATPQDLDDYPDFRRRLAQSGASPRYQRPICRGEIKYINPQPLAHDIANFKAALAQQGVDEGFMNAATPGVIAVFQPNQHYATQEEYIEALANAMRVEYEAIVEAGLLLQVDAPDLAMGRHIRFRDVDDAEFLRNAHLQVEALNYALQNVSADRVRMHLCWGNYEGPHTHDIGLDKIMSVVLKAKPQAILFEAANPRHAHEWTVWATAQQRGDLPEDQVLIPGVLDTTTNYIEHPELVAQRILRFTDMVGRARVLAGSDCGFGTFAGFGPVDPSICWGKLAAMAEGARLASAKLFA